MYVTPRPNVIRDPLYAALPVGLIAAQRDAFNPIKIIAGPIVMILLVYIMTAFVEFLRPMPLVYIGAMWLTCFHGFRLVLNTGAQAGMLIIIVAVLISVMGMNGTAIVEGMRNGFIQAALVGLVLGPLVYALLPAKTTEKHIDTPTPSLGNTKGPNTSPTKAACIKPLRI